MKGRGGQKIPGEIQATFLGVKEGPTEGTTLFGQGKEAQKYFWGGKRPAPFRRRKGTGRNRRMRNTTERRGGEVGGFNPLFGAAKQERNSGWERGPKEKKTGERKGIFL